MENWYNNGFETAKGTIGTGWMTFGKPEADEVLKENDIDIILCATDKELLSTLSDEKFREIISVWVEGWRETEQWNFEVGKHMPKQLIKNELNDNWLDAQSDWINGYTDYAYTYINHYARNHLGVCPICGAWLEGCLIRNVNTFDRFSVSMEGILQNEEGDNSSDEAIYCNECNAVLSTDEEELPSLIKRELVKTKDQVMIDTFFYYNNMIKVYKSIIKDFNELANKNNK